MGSPVAARAVRNSSNLFLFHAPAASEHFSQGNTVMAMRGWTGQGQDRSRSSLFSSSAEQFNIYEQFI